MQFDVFTVLCKQSSVAAAGGIIPISKTTRPSENWALHTERIEQVEF